METQKQILQKFAEFKHITKKITYETYFNDNTNMTNKHQTPYPSQHAAIGPALPR